MTLSLAFKATGLLLTLSTYCVRISWRAICLRWLSSCSMNYARRQNGIFLSEDRQLDCVLRVTQLYMLATQRSYRRCALFCANIVSKQIVINSTKLLNYVEVDHGRFYMSTTSKCWPDYPLRMSEVVLFSAQCVHLKSLLFSNLTRFVIHYHEHLHIWRICLKCVCVSAW